MKKLILFVSLFAIGSILAYAQTLRLPPIPRGEGDTIILHQTPVFGTPAVINYVATDYTDRRHPCTPIKVKIKHKDFEIEDSTNSIGTMILKKGMMDALKNGNDSVEIIVSSFRYKTISRKVKLKMPAYIAVRFDPDNIVNNTDQKYLKH
jgi:hypothetical protein